MPLRLRGPLAAAGLGLLVLLPSGAVQAGEADVVGAEAARESDGTWRFSVTVRHADAGWDHYADRWQVETPEGRVRGTRELLHPHEAEQPYTRSHDSVHGDGGRTFRLTLPR